MGQFSEYGPHETLTNSDVGFWGETHHNDQWTVGPVNRGFRDHSEVTHSNHQSPTDWYREVVSVLGESPSVEHWRWNDHLGNLAADYVSTRWVSPGASDPAFWYPPEGYFPILQNVSDKVTNQARNNLTRGGNGTDGFETGAAIGEAKATAEMLATRGSQMAKAIMNFRSHMASIGPVKGRAAALLAGAYLESYYGWRSLALDAATLYKELQAKMEPPLVIKTGSKDSDSYEETHGDQGQGKSTWTAKVEVGYRYKIHSEFLQRMNQWGLANPLSIAWELSPLSFVVDWFVPIGNTLSAISATAGLTFVDGYKTVVTEAYAEDGRNRPVYDDNLVAFDPGSYKRRIFRMNRGHLIDFEPPKLYGNRNPFSTPHILSAAALSTQAILGHG